MVAGWLLAVGVSMGALSGVWRLVTPPPQAVRKTASMRSKQIAARCFIVYFLFQKGILLSITTSGYSYLLQECGSVISILVSARQFQLCRRQSGGSGGREPGCCARGVFPLLASRPVRLAGNYRSVLPSDRVYSLRSAPAPFGPGIAGGRGGYARRSAIAAARCEPS